MVTGDKTYRVLVQYALDTKEAEKGTEGLASSLNSLRRLATGVFVGFSLKSVSDEITRIGSELENARIKFGAILEAEKFTGATNFNKALSMSNELIDAIKERSARLPGTWQNLADIMSNVMATAGSTGHTLGQMLDVSAKAQAVGFGLFGIDPATVSSSLTQILAGHARRTNPLFLRLAPFMDNEGEGLAKMSKEQRYEQITKAVNSFNDALEAQSHTWVAVSTSAKNYFEMAVSWFTQGIFDSKKSGIEDLNKWFQKNRDLIRETAMEWGAKLAAFLKEATVEIKAGVGFIVEHKEALLAIATAFAGVKIFSGLGAAATDLSKLGNFAKKAAENGEDLLTGKFQWLNALAVGFSELVVKVSLVSAALLAFYGVLKLLDLFVDKDHKKRVEDQGDLAALIDNLHKGRDAGAVLVAAQRMGALNSDATLNEKRFEDKLIAAGEHNGKELSYLTRSAAAAINSMPEIERYSRAHLLFGPNRGSETMNAHAPLSKDATQGKGHTNIQVKIEQTITEATDPERILIKTREAIEQSLIRPIQSPNNKFATLNF